MKTEKRQWYEKNRQHLTEFATQLAFSSEILLNLSEQGLTPVSSLSVSTAPLKFLETTIPILNYKTLQWHVDWCGSPIIESVFLKLGTGNRLNRCHLVLSVLHQQNETLILLATAQLAGHTVQDNQWAEFKLTRPLTAGRYLCQLSSPDADNAVNTLFLWLTMTGLDNYCYFPTLPKISNQLQFTPVISLLVILRTDTHLTHWRDCLNSVVSQNYPHWQLCVMAEIENPDQLPSAQVQWTTVPPQQSLASLYNQALERVQGEYVAVIAPEDVLALDALLHVVEWIHHATTPADLLYSDEDRINAGGVYYDPYFKPDWAVDMLHGHFYTGQLGIYRTELLRNISGFRDCAEPLWDMALRIVAETPYIQHIPVILYHRRHPKPSIHQTLTVVQDALDREQRGGFVDVHYDSALLHYPVRGYPLVSIVIPTRDMANILAPCLQSLCQLTSYSHWEIVLVDNGSREAATFAVFSEYQTRLDTRFKVLRSDEPFNFSRLVNHGVDQATGEFILLLNNDTRIVEPNNWLQEMLGFAQQPEIGCVSCKLLYLEDNTIQHAGLICGIGGIANPSHKYFPSACNGYFNRLKIVANYSAVTGACLLIKRALWEQADGFDENLAIAFNDVDFCLKLGQFGYRHVVLPHVIFYHEESKSRGFEDTDSKKIRLQHEQSYMEQRWGTLLQSDPFYSPHLTKRAENFSLSHESGYYCGEYLLA